MEIDLCGCVYGSFTIPHRVIITLVTFLSASSLFAMRVVMNVVINEMIPENLPTNKTHPKALVCPYDDDDDDDEGVGLWNDKVYNWTEGQQSFIRAAFYIGYVPGHIPAGACSDMFGAKSVLLTCLIVSSFFTTIIPLLIYLSSHWFLIGLTRIVIGLGQSLLAPAISSLVTHWIPMEERGTLGTIAFSEIGTVGGTILSGLLANRYGWEISFYVMGGIGFFMSITVYFTIYTTPAEHPYLTLEEQRRLIGSVVIRRNLNIPYKAILTDFTIWGLVAGEFSHSFIFFLFNTDLPKYLSQVLHFSIKNNGLISSIPPLGMLVCSICFGRFSDWLHTKKEVKIIHIRRWATFFGNMMPATICIVVGYLGCNKILEVTFLTLALTTKGPTYSGHKINFLELTKNYAGFVMALQNGLGALSGIVQPFIVGLLAPNHFLEEWRRVFYLCFGYTAAGTIVYMITASDTRKEWDYSNY